MAPTLAASQTFTFADGGAGHVCDLGSAPAPGQLDVLCVNSNTTVATPSGFTEAPSAVANQAAYIFRRVAVGGEGSTVTVTTSGDHNTQVSWSRWSGVAAADDAIATSVNGSAGTSSPAHSTGTLAESGELVIAFAALSNIGATIPTGPSWSAGYTPLSSAAQGTGSSGMVGFVGYKVGAGPAAESPSVSWTNNASNRYMLTVTFTASLSVGPASGVADVGLAFGVAASGDRVSEGDAATALALTVAAQGLAPFVGPAAGGVDLGVTLAVAAHGRAPGGSGGWFPHGEAVAVLRASLTDDGYGNQVIDWATATSTPYEGCAVAQGSRTGGTEAVTGDRDVVISDLIVFMPSGADVVATDRLEVRSRVYEVVGEPFDWVNPFTGTAFGVVVYCNRVEG